MENSNDVQNTTNVGNEVLADVMLSLPDIRNKLSPFKNLIAMLEGCKVEHSDERINRMLKHEIENCKKSIAYLSGNGA